MRITPNPIARRIALSGIAASLLLIQVQAQEIEQSDDAPVVINPFQEQPESDAARMTRLFQEVEQRMNRSTEWLFSASKGDLSALDQIKSSGLDDLGQDEDANSDSSRAALSSLLNASKNEGAQILSAIDEILEIAAKNGGT